jgi:hypothetical protein
MGWFRVGDGMGCDHATTDSTKCVSVHAIVCPQTCQMPDARAARGRMSDVESKQASGGSPAGLGAAAGGGGGGR